ncbi:amino acid adenylation domain-containing protein [Nocardia sp. NBC_00511]|uniref:amino acid adenylation domain-containing protein n=1 Tax=Nocardia sp. NBC_00511 TaxID=2903591 RepID=UPI0030E511A4
MSQLAAAVEHDPDAIAVRSDEIELSYRALDAVSNRWARWLCGLGVGPEDRVAVMMSRSVDSIAAIWAIAKTGAAFVPIDPSYPRARIEYQLADSGCAYGITHRHTVSELPGGVHWLAADDPDVTGQLAEESSGPISYLDRRGPLRNSNIAYLIYTSGSTGRPKGVGVTHTGLPGLSARLRTTLGLTPAARVLHFASPSFDASILEFLMAIGSAGTLVVAPPTIVGGAELATFLHRHRITHAFLTPSVLASIQPSGLDVLTTIVVGGEACPPALLRQWATPGRRFHNAYGPTETTIAATLSPALHAEAAVTLGAPVEGSGHHILDSRLRPTPVGAVGEMYVFGNGLARGYPGHPEPTAARFVPNPMGAPGERMYRTGDLVRRNSFGNLEYVGRIDDQVKVRGRRIELGEIDAALTGIPGVADAATVDRDTPSGGTELASFVRAHPDRPIESRAVLHALATRLPSYMLPDSITVLELFPLTTTGKIDRTALRTLPSTPSGGAGPVASVGEEAVADAFAHVLGHRALGSDTDFFAAGGNSLLATQVAARLSQIWKTRIPTQLLFDHPTVATLTKAIRSQHFDVARAPLLAGLRPDRIPLSPNQLRFWLRNQFDTASAVDNIGFALRLDGIDTDALRAALIDVVTRHEALRTRYPADDDGPRQEILTPDDVTDRFDSLDVGTENLSTLAHRILRQGFDVTTEVPLRIRLLRTPDEHILVCALHHICADGSSLAPLAADMAQAYAARHAEGAPQWQPLSAQYADYALWQRQLLGSREDPDSLLSQQLRYWARELEGLPEQLDLPADRPRPAVASLRGATLDTLVPADEHSALLGFARAHNASLFMVMHTALAVLFARLSATTDIAIGVPMTIRADPALDGVVGMFVNTTVSRTRVDLAETFPTLLMRTRDRDLANFAHSEVPFEYVVDAIDPRRSPGRHPLYQVGFAFQNFTRAQLDIPDAALSMFDVESDTVKTDLHIGVIDTRDEDGSLGPIAIRFGYSTDLFDRETIQRFLDAYLRLLRSIRVDEQTAVGDLTLADEADATQPDHPVPSEILTAALARQAAERPDAIAVVAGTESISFGGLYDRVTRLARWLIGRGIGPESIVAVAMRRSIDQVVALNAVAEAGAAWVPIDPEHPAERNGYVLDSAAPHCILTTSRDRVDLGGAQLVDELDLTAFATGPVHDRERVAPLRGDHPAYVIYTSGSTGRPKGVVVTHAAIVNQLTWMRSRYGVQPHDSYLHKTAATFDVSLWGYFLPLSAGARLILAGPAEHRDPHAISDLISAHAVTLTDFVPTMLALLARSARADQLRSLRAVFVIGEALAPDTARAFAQLCPAALHNLYGPTEAAVSITEHEVGEADLHAPTVAIGVPVWNSGCRVLDSRLHTVLPGVSGELVLTGVQLARGYHSAPGLTASRFVADPAGPPGSRMYRSGDLARHRADDILEYLGRTDFQVKIRGQRIELGEIEAVLLEDPDVAQAAVAVQRGATDTRLIGYAVLRAGTTADPKELRRKVSTRLPGYMVPSVVITLSALPVNTSGKLDRTALPAPTFTGEATTTPGTALEKAIAEAFSRVLEVPTVGTTDDFFDLGGSSLLIFLLHQQLSEQLGRDVPMSAILNAPTVGGLAAYLDGVTESPTSSITSDAVLEPTITPTGCLPHRAGPDTEVLLTGATGFLGVHLLHELLTRTEARVWCLVRARDDRTALHRIIESLKQFGLPTHQVSQRISALSADLSAPRLGLSASQFALLADRIDAIYHNGARVNHVEPYERLRATNVEGTRTILQLATSHRIKNVHFISTLGAAIPATNPPAVITEDTRLPATQVQDNGYLTSKWVAEELIRQAADRGVPATIYRPGTVTGHTRTGINNPDDAFWTMIRAAAHLSMAPEVGEATIPLVPVDYVAPAIVTLATQPHRKTVYHLVTHTPTPVRDILDCLRDSGHPITITPFDTLRATLDRRAAAPTNGDTSLPRAALLAPTFTALVGHPRCSDTHTREALTQTPIPCPTLDRPVIHRYLTQFTASGLLPTPHAPTEHASR